MAARAWGALLAFVAALLFAGSLVSPALWTDGPAWWDGHPTVDGREYQGKDAHVGLLQATGCDGHGCQDLELEPTFQTIEMVEVGATGLAILLALATALTAMRMSDRRKTFAGLTIGSTVVVAGGAAAVLVLGPALAVKQTVTIPFGLGAAMYGGGVVASMVGSILVLGARREPLLLKPHLPAPIEAAKAPPVDVRQILRDGDSLRPSALGPEPMLGARGGAAPAPAAGNAALFEGAPQLKPLYDHQGQQPAAPAPVLPTRAPTPIPRAAAAKITGVEPPATISAPVPPPPRPHTPGALPVAVDRGKPMTRPPGAERKPPPSLAPLPSDKPASAERAKAATGHPPKANLPVRPKSNPSGVRVLSPDDDSESFPARLDESETFSSRLDDSESLSSRIDDSESLSSRIDDSESFSVRLDSSEGDLPASAETPPRAYRPSQPPLARSVPLPPTVESLPPPGILPVRVPAPASANRLKTDADDRLATAMRETESVTAVEIDAEAKAAAQAERTSAAAKRSDQLLQRELETKQLLEQGDEPISTSASLGSSPIVKLDTSDIRALAADRAARADSSERFDTSQSDAAPGRAGTESPIPPPPPTLPEQPRVSQQITRAIPAVPAPSAPLPSILRPLEPPRMSQQITRAIPAEPAPPILPAVPVTPAEPPARPSQQVPLSTAPTTLPPPKITATLPSGPTPACPQCESPMAWVEEHLRFYCKSCRMYF